MDRQKSQAQSARILALYAICRVEEGGFSNIIINDTLKKNSLKESDKALFSLLVKGVTERRITLDYIISSLSSIQLNKIDKDALGVLRIGIYQLVFMPSVPKYAVVNECVNLSRKRSKGFVNAILRSFIRNNCEYALPEEKTERISVEYSVPTALAERFTEIFGEERAEKIFSSFLEKRYTDICINPINTDREIFIKKLDESGYFAKKGSISSLCIKTDAPYSFLEENFKGKFLAMDEASQLCALTLGMKEGECLLDTCAAPGSKSFVASLTMKNKGSVISCDLHASKLSLIKSGGEKLGIDIIEVLQADARNYIPEFDSRFDCVLCDVPCSGIGVIGGKPEIKYKDINDFAPLPKIQLDILSNASQYVKQGGRLVYSTCTLLPEENEKNVEAFLASHKDFSLEPFTVGCDETDGMITLTPDKHLSDGFFVAKMRRT